MARKIATQEDQPTEYLRDGDAPVPFDPPMVDPAPVVGNATAGAPKRDLSSVPVPKLYRVLKDGRFYDDANKSRSMMRAGKEISDLHYDIAKLQAQGIQLEALG